MNWKRVLNYCGVWSKTWDYDAYYWKVQLLSPKWNTCNRDYYLMFPTVFRLMIKSFSYRNLDHKETSSGFGVVILGFGFAILKVNW